MKAYFCGFKLRWDKSHRQWRCKCYRSFDTMKGLAIHYTKMHRPAVVQESLTTRKSEIWFKDELSITPPIPDGKITAKIEHDLEEIKMRAKPMPRAVGAKNAPTRPPARKPRPCVWRPGGEACKENTMAYQWERIGGMGGMLVYAAIIADASRPAPRRAARRGPRA